MSNSDKLTRIQQWLGVKTLGIYVGTYTASWTLAQFEAKAVQFAAQGVDYAIIKVGEAGHEWYNGTFPAIRAVFLKHGVGCAPFYFNRPQYWQSDASICAKLANEAGGIILDCEEQFLNQSGPLRSLVDAVRAQAPDKCIVVTGYGDPTTALGFGWDFSAIQNADGYQPQWYIGWWTPYKQGGWQYAIGWADGQCAQQFAHFGLGQDFPIQPAINVEGVNEADLKPLCQYLTAWKDGVAVWENNDINGQMIADMKAGLGVSVAAPVVATPPPVKRSYMVKYGDNLSEIASKLGIADWHVLYDENKATIGINPNLIHAGQILYY